MPLTMPLAMCMATAGMHSSLLPNRRCCRESLQQRRHEAHARIPVPRLFGGRRAHVEACCGCYQVTGSSQAADDHAVLEDQRLVGHGELHPRQPGEQPAQGLLQLRVGPAGAEAVVDAGAERPDARLLRRSRRAGPGSVVQRRVAVGRGHRRHHGRPRGMRTPLSSTSSVATRAGGGRRWRRAARSASAPRPPPGSASGSARSRSSALLRVSCRASRNMVIWLAVVSCPRDEDAEAEADQLRLGQPVCASRASINAVIRSSCGLSRPFDGDQAGEVLRTGLPMRCLDPPASDPAGVTEHACRTTRGTWCRSAAGHAEQLADDRDRQRERRSSRPGRPAGPAVEQVASMSSSTIVADARATAGSTRRVVNASRPACAAGCARAGPYRRMPPSWRRGEPSRAACRGRRRRPG